MAGANPLHKHFRKDDLSCSRLALDTSIFVSALITVEQKYAHEATKAFLKLLLEKQIQVVVSQIVYPEFWNVCQAMELRRTLPANVDPHKAIKDNPQLLKPHIPQIQSAMSKLFELRAKLEPIWKPVRVSERITASALEVQSKYLLDIHDAIHVASALESGSSDLATFDRGIVEASIPGLNIWHQFDRSATEVASAGEAAAS